MAVNVPGLIAVIVFYIIIFLIGILAARKKKSGDEAVGGEGEEVMLAGRNIGLFVGTFTMTGKAFRNFDRKYSYLIKWRRKR